MLNANFVQSLLIMGIQVLVSKVCAYNHKILNHSVMVNVLAWSAVNCRFEPRSSQTKYYKIGICWFSTKHAAKTGRLRIRIICQSWVTCLSADCVFSELALWKSNVACWSSTNCIIVISLKINLFSPWALNNNHSLNRISAFTPRPFWHTFF